MNAQTHTNIQQYRDVTSTYRLTLRQRVSCGLYLASFSMCLVAEVITCTGWTNGGGAAAQWLWLFGVPAFTAAGLLVLNEEGELIAMSRG